MTEKTNQNRSQLFVNNKIQGKALLRIAFYWGTYHVVLWHAMFIFRYFEYRSAVEQGAKPVFFTDLFGQFATQNYPMIICATLVFPFILWDMLKFSHRIAGPLQRFQTTLKAMTEGRTAQKVQLRKGDLLFDLQDSFNDYVETLEFNDDSQSPVESSSTMQENEASILGHLMNSDETSEPVSELEHDYMI